ESINTAGLVHGDLTPKNILIRDGDVKLLDVGMHQTLDAGDETATYIIGTPSYLAPERLRGFPATPKSDIYALGVILYQMLHQYMLLNLQKIYIQQDLSSIIIFNLWILNLNLVIELT
ncbi:hypothetical protein LCGC14_2605540, partial [marine sediment metagenome]